MKVVSVKQVDDTGKHGLTLINRLSTLFNQKCDNRNNLEIHYTTLVRLRCRVENTHLSESQVSALTAKREAEAFVWQATL